MEDLEVADTHLPSTSSPNEDDCRINCTNSESLRMIINITKKRITELVDTSCLKDQSAEFIEKFNNVFESALRENLVVNGLPWVYDKNKLTSPEKEDHKQEIDDVVLSQFSDTVSQVAYKRKHFTPQICRILDMKRKSELQKLKKVKVIDSSPSMIDSPSKYLRRNSQHIKQFSDFCKNFNSYQEIVQNELVKKEGIVKNINVATSIQTGQRTILKSIAADETVVVKKV